MAKKKIHSEVARTTINTQTQNLLWAVAAGRCEYCNKLLYEDGIYHVIGNYSNIAHIHAVSENGPRHKSDMTTTEKNEIENLMLLCPEHHHMVDTQPDKFPHDTLILKKRAHEERIRRVTGISDNCTCTVISYFSNLIDKANIETTDNSFYEAVIKANLIPTDIPVVKLSDGLKTDYEATKDFFTTTFEYLKTKYNEWAISLRRTDTVAVFAVAPQPLLFALGRLLGDQKNCMVFQYHRDSVSDCKICSKWAWPMGAEDDVSFMNKLTKAGNGKVALVIDLSATVVDSRITNVLSEDCSIYHLTIDNPNRYFVRKPEIQDNFIKAFRTILEQIKNDNKDKKEIHVFPVMPQSLAIRAGMDYMPKADLALVLYEQYKGSEGFYETITIGGE